MKRYSLSFIFKQKSNLIGFKNKQPCTIMREKNSQVSYIKTRDIFSNFQLFLYKLLYDLLTFISPYSNTLNPFITKRKQKYCKMIIGKISWSKKVQKDINMIRNNKKRTYKICEIKG